MWLDVFRIIPAPLHPMIYMAMCVLVSHHFMRYDLPHVQPTDPVRKEDVMLPATEPDAAETAERSVTALLTDVLYQQYNISPREQELVPLVLQGNSNQQIGETLFISLSTVKTHLRSIYSKFGVKNRYELIAFLQNLK
jgi:ATP/maltotriose-dependent transcriptional regulator MalT